jgi:hypothetical protein
MCTADHCLIKTQQVASGNGRSACDAAAVLKLTYGVSLRTGRAITGVNQTIKYVPPSGSLNRFGHATNWFFVGVMILSGAAYFANGIRYDTTSAGASQLNAGHRFVHLSVEIRRCNGACLSCASITAH